MRKELRKLTNTELNLYKQALRVMMSVPTAVGQKAFGPKYKDYDYFTIKHATAAYDPRGDQAHFSPALITYHRCASLIGRPRHWPNMCNAGVTSLPIHSAGAVPPSTPSDVIACNFQGFDPLEEGGDRPSKQAPGLVDLGCGE